MNTAQLEQEILRLSPEQRVQLAMFAWESLEDDPLAAENRALDPEGLALAVQRDLEMASGSTKPLTHDEFLRLTSRPNT